MIKDTDLVSGTRVEWVSQAGGFTVKKQGVIVAFVARGTVVPSELLEGEHRLHGIERSSTVDRYLIRLDTRGDRKAALKKNHYYLPVASVVRNGQILHDDKSVSNEGTQPADVRA